jgi:hypothetical protein
MALPEPFSFFIDPLERAGIAYCLTGSLAAGLYGAFRTTHDIDLVLLLPPGDLPKLQAAFPQEEFYVPPRETLASEMQRGQRGCANLYHHASGFKADLFFAVRDPLHLWAMKGRRRLDYHGEPLWVAPPEYVTIRKLEFFREGGQDKHIDDLCTVLAVTPLDQRFITANLDRLGLHKEWEELLEAYHARGGQAFW